MKEEGRSGKWKYDEMIVGRTPLRRGRSLVPHRGPFVYQGRDPDGTVACGAHDGEATEKKECLILTNKATMLLKTKDRKNEQSQTKPNSVGGKIGCAEKAMLDYEF